MYLVSNYPLAVALCIVTMLCWGSWANTQKLAGKDWPFQLFYWDYSIGVLLLALVFAFTLGSLGAQGRTFVADLHQADARWLRSAFIAGVVFNVSNLLLVAAIDIAGMAVAFPIGVGLALVLGVFSTYLVKPEGNPVLIALGVAGVTAAIVAAAFAYRRLPGRSSATPVRGIAVSAIAGILMGFFYRYLARAMGAEPGKLSPYTAVVMFSIGLLLSNFIFNTLAMVAPLSGRSVRFSEYFTRGTVRLHLVGILGGVIWNLGLSLNILASGAASPALSYGLGQGATMVAAIWGVFIWKEFAGAPKGTGKLLAGMFVSFAVGLGLLVAARL